MFGRTHRRERRALWGSLTLAIVIAIGGTLAAAASSRTRLTERAATDARLVAQTQLAPLLTARDLEGPITGDRARELGAAIRSEIVSTGPIEKIRLYSKLGRILYDADPEIVTVRPSFVRDLIYRVATGEAESIVREGHLLTYVPLWTSPGGTVVVAEMSQPYDPIAAEATGTWHRIALGLGLALAVTFALWVRAIRARDRTLSLVEVRAHPEFVAAEDARTRAEQRAAAAEAALTDVRRQLRAALDEISTMERTMEMLEQEDRSEEVRTLRDQLRDTAERLQAVERDNAALRERLALRQRELDEHKTRLLQLEARTPSAEVEELRRRLEAAERRATEMENEVERLEAELDATAGSLHLAKLSEALREIDNDDALVEVDEDREEHPTVIFAVDRPTTRTRR
jgi:predicted  nucleic acid-binding Zn-ribbon protein